MPYGNELHFGVVGAANVWELAQALGIKLYDDSADADETTDADDDGYYPIKSLAHLSKASWVEIYPGNTNDALEINSINDALEIAYQNTLNELGLSWVISKDEYGESYMVNTRKGTHRAKPFSIVLHYDTDEGGDGPDNMSLSIGLTSRYYPCLIDIESPHGGTQMVFDEDMKKRIDICKRHIIEQIPALKDAQIFVRELFY